jgi:putative ABC transport system substrate-binding protein
MIRRRAILGAMGAIALFRTLAVPAQEQGRAYRMAWVAEGTQKEWQRAKEYVLQGILAPAGFVPGANLSVDTRLAGVDAKQNDAMLAELAAANLDAITMFADPALVASLKRVAPRTPIIALMAGDAVNEGLIRSLAHPGGNITGITFIASETLGKRLELLKEVFPATRRVRLLTQQSESRSLDIYVAVAKQLGIELKPHFVESIADLDAFFARRLAGDEAVYVGLSAWNLQHVAEITAAANRARAPAIYPLSQFVDAGGLATYQADMRDAIKRLGEMTLLVLRGKRPAEIPFEQEPRFQMILNQKAARATGITFLPPVLLRADRVIE